MIPIPSVSHGQTAVASPTAHVAPTTLCETIYSCVKTFFVYVLLVFSLTFIDLREKDIKIETDGSQGAPMPGAPIPSTPMPGVPLPPTHTPNPPVALGTAHIVTPIPSPLTTHPVPSTTLLPPTLHFPASPFTSPAVSPTPLVSASCNPVIFPAGLPTREQNLQIYNYLAKEAPYLELKIEFEVDGVAMCAWKSISTDSINIQELGAFSSSSLDHQTSKGHGGGGVISAENKLGLSFTDQGEIACVYVDGINQGTEFPKEKVKWMKGLKERVLSPQDSMNLEQNMVLEMKTLHKGLGNNTLLTLSDGTDIFAWYNPHFKVILMQPVHLSQVSPTDKLGLLFDEEGMIQSVNLAGTSLGTDIPDDKTEWVEALKQKCFEEKRTRVAAERKPAQKFDKLDLVTLKTFLEKFPNRSRPLLFECDSTTYGAWTYQGVCFIQKKEDIRPGSLTGQLSLKIGDHGQLEGFRAQGTTFKSFSKKHLQILNACMMNFVLSETEYTSVAPHPASFLPDAVIDAKIIKQAIARGVRLHLNQYAHHLETVMTVSPGVRVDPKLSLVYINERLQSTGGIDAGGLSRGFFPDIVAAICDRQHQDMHVVKRVGAHRPMTQMEPTEEEPELRMTLSENENEAWHKLGKMMMHCFHSESTAHYTTVYVLGSYFDDTLYKMILSLTPEEIDGGIENISQTRLLQLMEILIKTDQDGAQSQNTLNILKVSKENPNTLTNTQIAESFYNSGGDCEDWGDDCLSSDSSAVMGVDIEKVKENWTKVWVGLLNGLLSSPYAREIAPAFAIASGMKSIVSQSSANSVAWNNQAWRNMNGSTSDEEFAKKIQGTIDRATISSKFELTGHFLASERENVQEKVDWIKRWIESDATDDEVKEFLRFVTGGMSLPDKNIKVNPSLDVSPLPGAHTCSIELDIKATPTIISGFDDTNYQGFIKCLKSSMETDGIIG